jgi:hypothetical protein
MSTNCQPDPATENASGELTDTKSEGEWKEDIEVQYILSIKTLENYCEDCGAPGCEANCEYELTSLPVAQMAMLLPRPMPCEPPPPGAYFPSYRLAVNPDHLNKIPEELYELSGTVTEVNTEKIGEERLSMIADLKIVGIGNFAWCLPPPPPPPIFSDLRTNFLLEIPGKIEKNMLGLLYKDDHLVAKTYLEFGQYNLENNTTTLPFHSLKNTQAEDITGNYTYIIRFSHGQRESKIATELRFENVMQ